MTEPITEITVRPESGISLNYRLFKSCIDNRDCYNLYISQNFKNEPSEIFFEDVTDDSERALEIVFALAKGTVTPETAEYIVEELISAMICT